MKKIFAIALALVMVLSMASAFASACVTGPFNWSATATAANCGKGKVEVVPFVKVNDGCGNYVWQANNCAAAINSENVYYAVKLTVEPKADNEWWKAATLKVELKGLKGTEGTWGPLLVLLVSNGQRKMTLLNTTSSLT